MVIKGLEEVALRINWSPVGIPDVFLCGRTHSPKKADFGCTELRKVALGFNQRRLIGTAGKIWKTELNAIVLPKADGANVIRAWRFVEYKKPATRTGKSCRRGEQRLY